MFPVLLRVQRADATAKAPSCKEESLQRIEAVKELSDKILKRGDCVSLKELKLSGKDLMTLGMKPGPEIGEALTKALEQVLEDPKKNNREYLMTWIKNQIF